MGIIGGSGLYAMAGNLNERVLDTPFGPPSDAIFTDGERVAFLPRHGRGHKLMPSEINYRANIHALKQVGCTRILSVSAVGSLKENIHPGDLVAVTQFIDRTRSRIGTFFGRGVVGHVAMAEPVCEHLRKELFAAAHMPVHDGGTYVCIEGPQFSTKAESHEFRGLGCSVIGMTNAPEYKLAREAQLCYATLALVTDYDCWHEGHEVTLEQVLSIMHKNVGNAQQIIAALLARLGPQRSCACTTAAKTAVITDPKHIPEAEKPLLALLQS